MKPLLKIYYLFALIILFLVACSESSDDGGQGTAKSFDERSWIRKADFPGTSRISATGFSIGTKGYMVCGWTSDASSKLGKEFWEYDQATDSWTQKDDFPGAGRNAASGFAIGNKGYLVCGWSEDDNDGSILGTQFWEWDQTTDTWTQKTDFPGEPRISAAGFAIGNKGYLVCGWIENANSKHGKEFWEWEQDTDKWTQKSDFPGPARYAANGFAIGTKGYMVCGSVAGASSQLGKEIWEWDQLTDTWTQKADFTGAPRNSICSFAIGTNAYFVCGSVDNGDSTILSKEFWTLQ